MMKKIQKGFTLIELMIVIAIIGILAAIAIPAYQDYVTRSQVTEGMSLAAGLKTQIAEFHANAGLWPDGIDDLPANVDGTPRAPEDVSGKYVFSVTITQGTMEILYGNDANANVNGKTVALQPFLNANGDVIWRCGNANDPEGASNNSTLQLDGNVSIPGTTDVLDKYMPANCRTGAVVVP